jgi:hypothetical protein
MGLTQIDGHIDEGLRRNYADSYPDEDDMKSDPNWLKDGMEAENNRRGGKSKKLLFKYSEKVDETKLTKEQRHIKPSTSVATTRQQRGNRDTRKNSSNSISDVLSQEKKNTYNNSKADEDGDEDEKMLQKALAESMRLEKIREAEKKEQEEKWVI